ncbi:MAG: hypothetical protein QOD63_621 [Actinomycetota bacterium]|nr:hypothetical protein [Actinomycetota bacterium]
MIDDLTPSDAAPLPRPRGPLSAHILDHLTEPVHPVPDFPVGIDVGDDTLVGDDFHLALYVCYELHYRGFAGVDAAWEWEPSLLALRRLLESAFEAALRSEVPYFVPTDVEAALAEALTGDGPSLSGFMAERGTRAHFREFAIHRSAYQLKEADPHTWCIPRLSGGAKSAMVLIQADEYGDGLPGGTHAELFAETMQALGLDPSYGAYIDVLPGTTLATVNLVSMFGLHRRLRGALVGHLAGFEMTSVGPMGRYSQALRRLGLPRAAHRFYDVHVEADVVHGAVASTRMAAGLASQEPELAGDIIFGAGALTAVETRFARQVLASWDSGTSSLRGQVPSTTS